MGKIEENKQQKLTALFDSAYELFVLQGISKTSIHDIVQKAGVAKGTFYLYFKDKYDIRDKLITKISKDLFIEAQKQLELAAIPEFEDKVIFVVDYVLNQVERNKAVLKLISKNLSWGVYKQALMKSDETENEVWELFYRAVEADQTVKLRAPEIMLFLIIELASSTSYSTIVENNPISYEELKPYLDESIRAIIRNHIIE